jgi:hypothetical protein
VTHGIPQIPSVPVGGVFPIAQIAVGKISDDLRAGTIVQGPDKTVPHFRDSRQSTQIDTLKKTHDQSLYLIIRRVTESDVLTLLSRSRCYQIIVTGFSGNLLKASTSVPGALHEFSLGQSIPRQLHFQVRAGLLDELEVLVHFTAGSDAVVIKGDVQCQRILSFESIQDVKKTEGIGPSGQGNQDSGSLGNPVSVQIIKDLPFNHPRFFC